jgi:hypothetical protein
LVVKKVEIMVEAKCCHGKRWRHHGERVAEAIAGLQIVNMAAIRFSAIGGVHADGRDGVGDLDAALVWLFCSSERKVEEESAGKGMTCRPGMAASLER